MGDKPPIARNYYSWEEQPQRKRKPFYTRWWFWGPLATLALLAVVGTVGISIFTAKFRAIAYSIDLSDINKMESATLVYDRHDNLVGKFFLQDRIPVTADQISPWMTKAVIAAEDNRFYEHKGVDFWGIFRAALKNYRSGRIRQGASTVTQQLARNSFDMHERTYKRKIVEIFLAERIEKYFTKEQIMTMYLNRVYFGSGLYGIEAAARGYFGVPAKDLTVGQCATLASLLKNPNRLSPWNNPDGARDTRNFVLGRMHDLGFIDGDEMKRLQDSILVTSRRTNAHKVSYAVDYVRQQAIATLGYQEAMRGGFKIYTTLDLPMQRTAELTLRGELNSIEQQPGYNHETYAQFAEKFKPFDDILRTGGFPTTQPPTPQYLQGAVLAYDNRDGGILVLIGGREFKHSEYNRAMQSKRPAGTAFTPFVLAAACEKGMFPGEIVQDSALDNRYVGIGGTTGILGEWGVERAGNKYDGGIPAREAIAEGKNAATIRIGWNAGLDAVRDVAHKAGIRSPLRNFSNTLLGASEVSLDELTLAYTIFPDGGMRPKKPYIIDHIVDGDGQTVFKSTTGLVPAISDSTAFQVNAALQDVLRTGTGAAARTKFRLGDFPAAAKTGTAYNFTDVYTIGYTSAVTCGVWIGFDRPTKIYRGAFGNDLALPVWCSIMNASAEEFPPQPIKQPPSIVPVSVCKASGLLETPRCVEDVTDPTTGQVRKERTSYIEYATLKSKPTIPCDVHGTGVRLYTQELEQSEWPRASSAVDLSTIRPIAVSAPALVGLNDVYHSVRPAALRISDDEIPVAKAEPVDQQAAAAALAASKDPVPVARAVAVDPKVASNQPDASTPPASSGPPEVRRAEPVKPLDVPASSPAVPVAVPPPIQF